MLPPYIIKSFDEAPQDEYAEQFYGPWLSVLVHFFDIAKGYTIYPAYLPFNPFGMGPSDPPEIPISFVVKHNKLVIFFVQVKAPNSLKNMSSRRDADALMRDRFFQLLESFPSYGIISGISAFGSQCSIYTLDGETNRIVPPTAG
ncbi:hypothetical protein D9613_007986 [Agrocybe pediades]|uniref:Uncharacterized protein n=1 Tax=Agrocybe pediades TaxID=84607 RepID=A0A8H4QMW0_9AGAR|nr:hypothetical protein D9613_007986 [Agrocybe pediades]